MPKGTKPKAMSDLTTLTPVELAITKVAFYYDKYLDAKESIEWLVSNMGATKEDLQPLFDRMYNNYDLYKKHSIKRLKLSMNHKGPFRPAFNHLLTL